MKTTEIFKTLEKLYGSKALAAAALGISSRHFYRLVGGKHKVTMPLLLFAKALLKTREGDGEQMKELKGGAKLNQIGNPENIDNRAITIDRLIEYAQCVALKEDPDIDCGFLLIGKKNTTQMTLLVSNLSRDEIILYVEKLKYKLISNQK